MSIAVSTPGKFQPAYLWARWLEQRGALQRIISLVPHARTRQFGVSEARTTAIVPFGAWNHAFQRFAPAALQGRNQLVVSAAFDAAVARMIGGASVFNGWTSASLHSIRAARRSGIPAVLQSGSAHILTQTALLEEEHRRFGLGNALTHPGVMERTLAEYEEADVIVVPSAFVRRTFIDQGVSAEKLRVVHEVALPLAPAAAPPPSRDSTIRVLYVGRSELRKGTPYLLQAFRRVTARASLRLVGASDAALYQRAGGLPPLAEAVGPRTGDGLAAEYAQADVFVLPSIEDGFGLVAAEAMAASLPVIVSANAGASDLVVDGVNGFVVRARDADALAQRIDTLAADDALRRRMGAAARATAASRTWQSYGEQMWRDVYAPLLQESRAAA